MKIERKKVVSTLKALNIEWNGWRFLVIYGKWKNGWFVAVPNFGVCIECAPPDIVRYNSEKLESKIGIDGAGEIIAKAIEEEELWEK